MDQFNFMEEMDFTNHRLHTPFTQKTSSRRKTEDLYKIEGVLTKALQMNFQCKAQEGKPPINLHVFFEHYLETPIGRKIVKDSIKKNPKLQNVVLDIKKKEEREFNLSCKKTLLNKYKVKWTTSQYNAFTTQGFCFHFKQKTISNANTVVKYLSKEYFDVKEKIGSIKINVTKLLQFVDKLFVVVDLERKLFASKNISDEELQELIDLNILYYEKSFGLNRKKIIENNNGMALVFSTQKMVTSGVGPVICISFDGSDDDSKKKYIEMVIKFPKSSLCSQTPLNNFPVAAMYHPPKTNDSKIIEMLTSEDINIMVTKFSKRFICTDLGAVYGGGLDQNNQKFAIGNCSFCMAKNRSNFIQSYLGQTFTIRIVIFNRFGINFKWVLCLLHKFENFMGKGFLHCLSIRHTRNSFDNMILFLKTFDSKFTFKVDSNNERDQITQFTLNMIKEMLIEEDNFKKLKEELELSINEIKYFELVRDLFLLEFCSYEKKIAVHNSINQYISILKEKTLQFKNVCMQLQIAFVYHHIQTSHFVSLELELMSNHQISHFELCNAGMEMTFHTNRVSIVNKFYKGGQKVGKTKFLPKTFLNEVIGVQLQYFFLLITPPQKINQVSKPKIEDLKEKYLYPLLKPSKRKRIEEEDEEEDDEKWKKKSKKPFQTLNLNSLVPIGRKKKKRKKEKRKTSV